MKTINFDTLDQLLNFINITKDIEGWETVIFRISASNGMELNINTKIQNSIGFRDYTELKKLKMLLNNFYTQNNYLSINLEVKLKFPSTMKETIDPNDNFEAFYIDFYADDMSYYMILSFKEKDIMEEGPVTNWAVYVTNLYEQWRKKNGY